MRDVVPYFPCYAENIIADRSYRSMSLLERGLWISIYLECWPNISVPQDTKKMSKILGFGLEEIESIAMGNIMKFFQVKNGEITSNELNKVRQDYIEKRLKQSAGGTKGAQIKKAKAQAQHEGTPEGIPAGSSNQINSDQFNSNSINSHKDINQISHDENSDDDIPF